MIRLATTTIGFGVLVFLAGCGLPSPRSAEAVHDFGPPDASGSARIERTIEVFDVVAPAWLDTERMAYRLLHVAPTRLETYAQSRWAATPAALLSQRLRARLASQSRGAWAGGGPRADMSLRIELDDFSQVFDGATSSRVLLRLRATLALPGSRTVQTAIAVERPAPSPDARGGAAALVAASDEALRQVAEWVASAR